MDHADVAGFLYGFTSPHKCARPGPILAVAYVCTRPRSSTRSWTIDPINAAKMLSQLRCVRACCCVVGIAWMGCSSVCVFLPDLLVCFSAVLMYCRQHAREMTMDFAGSNAASLYCASLWCVCVLCACSVELVAARCRFVRHMYLCLTSIISIFDRKLLLLSCESDRV
jgi:hypothetical protein